MPETEPPRALVVALGNARPAISLSLRGPTLTIGRSADNLLCLAEDRSVSRRHCTVHVTGAGLTLEDHASRNGTYLNGERIAGVVPLVPPAWILVGRTRLAIVPPAFGEGLLDDLRESTYTHAGSILIPPDAAFEERTEAFLVVDVVDSTRLIQRSAHHLPRIVHVLGTALERALDDQAQPFLKCLGDGFFACFDRPGAALRAAEGLGPRLAAHFSDPIQVSIALHYGTAHLTERGDRTGRDVHAVFALEKLRHDVLSLGEGLRSGRIRRLILLTEAFHARLDEADWVGTDPIGTYVLKGLDEPVRVYRRAESVG